MESWVGMKRDCFVRRSTITNIAMCPSDAGSCSIKSIEMDSHGHGGIGSCLRKPYGLCLFALERAHTVQDRMYCLTIWVRPGVDGVGALNHATNPNYPNTEPRMSRIKTRTGPSVSGSTVAKTHFSNQNKQMNPLFQKLDRP